MSTGLVFSVLIRRSDDVDDDENVSTLHFFSDPETLNIDRSNKSKENSKILLLLLSLFTHNNNRDTTKMSKDLVLLYCTQQNRPFNATNLADALQKEGVKKATAQRYLDNLVEEKKLSFKESGKSKLYYALQPEDVLGKEEVHALEFEVKTKTLD